MTITPITTRSVQSDLPAKGKPVTPVITLPVLPSRERILLYGREGTGKTESWLSIAEMWPEAKFFVVDTDDSVQRMLETDHKELTNISCTVAQNWEAMDKALDTYIAATIGIVQKMKQPIRKEDLPWIIVDFADATWDMVQNFFTESIFGKSTDEYFLQARKTLGNSKQLQPLDGWTDWQVINKIFQSRWNTLTKGGGPFHLCITAKAVEPSGDLEAKSLYKSLKKMPGGEKRMGGRVHTVLMASVDNEGWYLSTAKDRGRPLLSFHKNSKFAISYLMKIAGWEV